MPDRRISLNGINGLTGEYLAAPLTPAEAAALARQTPPTQEKAGWFSWLVQKFANRFFGLPLDVDPTELSQAGWAVVFTPDTPQEVRQAPQPLLDHRAGQAPPSLLVTASHGMGGWAKDRAERRAELRRSARSLAQETRPCGCAWTTCSDRREPSG